MFSQPTTSRAWTRFGLALLLVLVTFQLAACAAPETSRSQGLQRSAPPTADPEAARLREGMDLFKKADYPNALLLFEELSRTAQSEPTRRRALYAQACTRLIMAQSAEEYNSALAVWQSWTRLEPPGAEEDPRMLSPILEKISPTLPPEPKESATLPTTRPSRKKPGSVYVNKDLAAYKSMMESKQKEFDRLKTRLDGKEREVRRLKQQIESLEAIHLKFQERQKETSTP